MKRLLLVFLLSPLAAGLAQLPDRVTERPPSPDPTKVKVGVYYVDISEIDGAREAFKATAYLDMEWSDPRLKFTPTHDGQVKIYKPEEIWTPTVEVINAESLAYQLPPICTVTDDGTVYYFCRLVATLNTQMDLRLFPFDQQQMKFVVESDRHGVGAMVFMPDPEQSGLSPDLVTGEWRYDPLKWEIRAEPFANTGEMYSRAVFTFDAHRNSSYFVWKVILPTAIFVLLTWSVLWLQIHDVQTAIVVSITVLLTAVVFGTATDALVPKLGYRTWLDQFQLGSFLFIVSTAIEAVVVFKMDLSGRSAGARKVRGALRFIYPLAYAAFCAALFLRAFR